MSEKIKVVALRSFELDHGIKTPRSGAFLIDRRLFNQLKSRNLVEACDAADDTGDAPPAPPAPPVAPLTAEQFIEGTIPDVLARVEGATAEQLKAALDAETEKGEKARKGVTDALTAALAEVEKA